MDTQIKFFISLISVNFMNLIKASVYCRLDECIRSSVDFLIKIIDKRCLYYYISKNAAGVL